MSEIKTHITELAAKLKGKVEKDANGNFAVSLDTFKETLPEGMDAQDVRKTMTYLQDYGLAVAVAAQEDTLNHLKETKGLERVIVKADLPVGKITHIVHRDKVARNPINGEEIHNVGGLTSRMQIKIGGNQFKAVSASYLERAKKLKLEDTL